MPPTGDACRTVLVTIVDVGEQMKVATWVTEYARILRLWRCDWRGADGSVWARPVWRGGHADARRGKRPWPAGGTVLRREED